MIKDTINMNYSYESGKYKHKQFSDDSKSLAGDGKKMEAIKGNKDQKYRPTGPV